jgi:hypothetical protein
MDEPKASLTGIEGIERRYQKASLTEVSKA